MNEKGGAAVFGSWARWSALAGAMLTGRCLLTTSLDGLEGPPLVPDAGAGGASGSGGAPEASPDVELDGGLDGGTGGGSSTDGNAVDRTMPDAVDASDGATQKPLPVADAGGTLRGITVNTTDVYWVQSDANAGIVRAPKTGGGSPAFAHMTPDAIDVAVDANYVYWTTSNNKVFRKPLGSTASAEFLFPGAGATLYLVMGAGDRIYLTGNDVVAWGSGGDAGLSYALYFPQMGAAGIALNGADLYWSAAAGIIQGTDIGQLPTQTVYSGGDVEGVATDGQEIFWVASDGAVRALSRNNPGGAAPRDVCRGAGETSDAGPDARSDGAPRTAIADIAVDEQWVYFTEPDRGRISKCAK